MTIKKQPTRIFQFVTVVIALVLLFQIVWRYTDFFSKDDTSSFIVPTELSEQKQKDDTSGRDEHSDPMLTGLLHGIELAAQIAESVSAQFMVLVSVGEADALKGKVVYASRMLLRPSGIVVAIEDGKAYSPFHEEALEQIPDGEIIASVERCKRFNHDDVHLSILDADETAAIVQHGQLGRLSNATVVLVRGLPADDIFEYARLYIRVFDNEKKVAEIELGDDSYPCALILDDFDGIPGNEVAVSWLSVANGYTAGVTVFRAEYRLVE